MMFFCNGKFCIRRKLNFHFVNQNRQNLTRKAGQTEPRQRSRLEHLHPMVLPVAHQDVSIGHDGNALEALEFGVTGAPGTERPQEAAVRVEDLDPIVARVGHADVALVVDGDAPGKRK